MLRRAASRVALAAAVFAMVADPASSFAASPARCVSADEAEAFQIRHLQSRLMVAGLGCNQQAAYNSFVENFRERLVDAGHRLTKYYARTGGGQTALNSHVTELANAAGLYRAEAPTAYCTLTWDLFLLLQDEPGSFFRIAAANTLNSVRQPDVCAADTVIKAQAPPSGAGGEAPTSLEALSAVERAAK